MKIGETILALFRYSGIAMILFIGFQYHATWKVVREDYNYNCHAFCKQQVAQLEILEFQMNTGNVLCTCDNLDIAFYGNNYSYVREPTINDILTGGFDIQ